MIYAITLVVTELITNNAAAALMFPLALATARNLGVNPMPFIIVVMMAASAGFATPIGYQTNLMVYGPGGYRFSDYVKIGVPLDILIGMITVLLARLSGRSRRVRNAAASERGSALREVAGLFRPQVRPEGFEPPTLGSEDRCSIQLSYRRIRRLPASYGASNSTAKIPHVEKPEKGSGTRRGSKERTGAGGIQSSRAGWSLVAYDVRVPGNRPAPQPMIISTPTSGLDHGMVAPQGLGRVAAGDHCILVAPAGDLAGDIRPSLEDCHADDKKPDDSKQCSHCVSSVARGQQKPATKTRIYGHTPPSRRKPWRI